MRRTHGHIWRLRRSLARPLVLSGVLDRVRQASWIAHPGRGMASFGRDVKGVADAGTDISKFLAEQPSIVASILHRRGLNPLPQYSSRVLEKLPKLPREDGRQLEELLEYGGTVAVTGSSNNGKTFRVINTIERIRERQCGTVLVPVDLSCTDAELQEMRLPDAFAAAFYLSLRGLPTTQTGNLGTLLFKRLVGWPGPLPVLSGADFQTLLYDVLEKLREETRQVPYFIMDDIQHMYSSRIPSDVQTVLLELVQMLHLQAGNGRLNLVFIMSDDVTDRLSELSGMQSRLVIFQSQSVRSDVLRKELLVSFPDLTEEDTGLIVDSVGGHIGDVENMLRDRKRLGSVKAAADHLLRTVADKMIAHIKTDPEPGMAHFLLKQLCEEGEIALDEADLPFKLAPEAAMQRLVAKNLARKLTLNLHRPYRPAQRKAWPAVEADRGVQRTIAQAAPLKEANLS